MSHNYLFDTHTFLNQEQLDAQQMAQTAGEHTEPWYIARGRLQALAVFQAYLDGHVNPKLPRRLYRRWVQRTGRPTEKSGS